MADRVETFDVTIPAGTASTAPYAASTVFNDGVVERVTAVVPAGPSGLMGFALTHSGQQIIPRTLGAWIITDDEKIALDLTSYPTGGSWGLLGYNTDIYPHTVHLRYEINELTAPAHAPVTIVGIS